MRRAALRERLAGAAPYAVVLAAAAYFYVNAGTFAALARPGELGPQFWPRAVLGLLMLVCGGAILRAVMFPPARSTPLGAGSRIEEDDSAQGETAAYPYRLLGGVALSAAYVAGMERLGFFLATALYLALFMWLGRYRRPGVIVTISLIGSLAFVFVFMKIVYVSLPLGVAPFQAVSVAILALLGIR
ncbi:MAG TPA: tripartite tricarboxylate transporter TctB family protein [Casimicrobiaceae bacterium]|jgi:putative tricarboxylic transport membrane protein|nr:tripartite tricarboxylate transporter TctB family protein [Casimicrobiaceae bacterium]